MPHPFWDAYYEKDDPNTVRPADNYRVPVEEFEGELSKDKEAEVERQGLHWRMPDDSEPLTMWRAWHIKVLDSGAVRLQSIGFYVIWEPGKRMEAECKGYMRNSAFYDPHTAPSLKCECGIYAKKHLENTEGTDGKKRNGALNWGAGCWDGRQEHTDRVMGLVYLWGDYLAFTEGARAQYAYPAELFVHPNTRKEILEAAGCETPQQLAAKLRAAYGVEVSVSDLGRPVKKALPAPEPEG